MMMDQPGKWLRIIVKRKVINQTLNPNPYDEALTTSKIYASNGIPIFDIIIHV